MSKKINRGVLSEDQFNKVHLLSREGLSIKEISQVTGWTDAGIRIWLKSPTWADYVEHKRAYLAKYRARKTQATDNNTIPLVTSAGHMGTPLEYNLDQLDKSLESLKELVSGVIELAVKERVDREMSKVAVELRELRILKDQAKVGNWTKILAEKLGDT